MQQSMPPPELADEYARARNIGAVIDVMLPIAGLIFVSLSAPHASIAETPEPGALWLSYALAAFSIATCIVARVLLTRLMTHIQRLLDAGHYRPGRLQTAYLNLYALYLMPAVWGFAHFLLTGGLITLGALTGVTLLSFLFLTPHYLTFLRR